MFRDLPRPPVTSRDLQVRHQPTPAASKVRLIEGGDRAYSGAHAATAAATINDWLEGARRLDGDDIASWSIYGAHAPKHASPAATAATPQPAADDSPLVGTMARAVEIQLECLADDIPLKEAMATWTETVLRDYFDSGGEESGTLV